VFPNTKDAPTSPPQGLIDYLATQRKYDAAQVWPHDSVPLDILKNLGLSVQDKGVDGVLQTLLGQFNAYRERFGNCRVPQNWQEDEKLARWVSAQRLDYGRGDISRERIAKLEQIGFDWSAGKPTWDYRFSELCTYKERFGNTLVPVKWRENPLLGGWVSAQRYKHNAGKLRKDFAERLNSIGFEWRAPNTFLQSGIPLAKRIEALLAHKAEHGHLTVSRSSEKYPGLAQWMTEQRKLFNDGTISEQLKRQLDEIGFPWKPAALRVSERLCAGHKRERKTI